MMVRSGLSGVCQMKFKIPKLRLGEGQVRVRGKVKLWFGEGQVTVR